MSKLHDKFLSIGNKLKNDQLPLNEIHSRVLNGVQLKGAPLLILICSALVGSIGLNINSVTVVVGAKLLAPLLIMIIGVSYGTATYNADLAKKSLKLFALQCLIIILVSTLYFLISPIKIPTDELIGKTQVNISDMLIAIIGGSCAVIATTRYERYNVLPGVAIATSLVPPACTIGYGIATLNPKFFFGALYLFSVNVIFIMFSTYVVFKLLNYDDNEYEKIEKPKNYYNHYILFFITLCFFIPIMISTVKNMKISYDNSNDNINATNLIENEFNNDNSYVVDKKIDIENKVITIFIVNNKSELISDDQKNELLKMYNLQDYALYIVEFKK